MEQAQATQPAAPAAGLPSIGEVLSTSWGVATKHMSLLAPQIAPLAGVVVLHFLFAAWMPGLTFLSTLLLIVAQIYTGIVVGRMLYSLVMTGNANADAAKKDAMKVFWPLLAIAIILGVMVGVGLMIFVIPGIILGLMYFAAPWAVLIDGKGIGDAMSMSSKLTKGRKWQLFVLLFVVGLVWSIVAGVVMSILVGILTMIGGGAGTSLSIFLGGVAYAVLLLFFYPLFGSVKAMVYGHLKKLNGIA